MANTKTRALRIALAAADFHRAAYEMAIDFVAEPRTAKARRARREALREAGVVLDHNGMSARCVPRDDGSRTAEGDCLAYLIDALTCETS